MKTRAWLVVALAGILSCTSEPTAVDTTAGPEGIRPAIRITLSSIVSDSRNGGDHDLYFLWPIVPEAAPRDRPFEADAKPTVTICRLQGESCSSTVAEFPFAERPGFGLKTTRQFARFEFYLATWLTSPANAGQRYRATVRAYGVELGFADIQVVRRLTELRGVPVDVVGVLAGLPLPIPFRIEATRTLSITHQPSLEKSGERFSEPIRVEIHNRNQYVVDTAVPISISYLGNNGSLLGTMIVMSQHGKATFSDLRFAGEGYVQLNLQTQGAIGVLTDTIRVAAQSRTIDPAQLTLLEDSADQAVGRYSFRKMSGAAPRLGPGMVILGTTGEGYLRRIVSVEDQNDNLILQTEQASIADLGLAGTFQDSLSAEPAQAAASTRQNSRVLASLSTPTLSLPIAPCGVAEATVSFTPTLAPTPGTTKLITDRFGVPTHFETQLKVTLATDAEYKLPLCDTPGGGAVGFSIPIIQLPPIPIPGLPIPVSLTGGLGTNLNLKSTISGKFSGSLKHNRTLILKVSCNLGIFGVDCAGIPTTSATLSTGPIDLAPVSPGNFEVTQGIGVNVGVRFAGVTGVQLSGGPFAGWKANDSPLASRLDVSCKSGWGVSARVFAGIFGFNATYTFWTLQAENPDFCQVPLAYSGFLSGKVASTARGPLGGVTVTTGSQTATTSSDGKYTLFNVPAGLATIHLNGLPVGCTDPGVKLAIVNANQLTALDFPVSCTPTSGPGLLYADDFANGLGNWTIYNPDGLGRWFTQNGELFGDYNIGCGNPSCQQTQLLLNSQFQPAGNWRMVVKSGLTQAYCCFNGGAMVNLAKFTLFVSAGERESFDLGATWQGLTAPSIWTQTSASHQAYPWHIVGTTTVTVPAWSPSDWQTATLEKVGDQYTLYFNGVQIYQVRRSFSATPQIGFTTYGGVRMDDFQLYSLP